jgi:hypothetical protein
MSLHLSLWARRSKAILMAGALALTCSALAGCVSPRGIGTAKAIATADLLPQCMSELHAINPSGQISSAVPPTAGVPNGGVAAVLVKGSRAWVCFISDNLGGVVGSGVDVFSARPPDGPLNLIMSFASGRDVWALASVSPKIARINISPKGEVVRAGPRFALIGLVARVLPWRSGPFVVATAIGYDRAGSVLGAEPVVVCVMNREALYNSCTSGWTYGSKQGS